VKAGLVKIKLHPLLMLEPAYAEGVTLKGAGCEFPAGLDIDLGYGLGPLFYTSSTATVSPWHPRGDVACWSCRGTKWAEQFLCIGIHAAGAPTTKKMNVFELCMDGPTADNFRAVMGDEHPWNKGAPRVSWSQSSTGTFVAVVELPGTVTQKPEGGYESQPHLMRFYDRGAMTGNPPRTSSACSTGCMCSRSDPVEPVGSPS
jgi:hypothetical protein